MVVVKSHPAANIETKKAVIEAPCVKQKIITYASDFVGLGAMGLCLKKHQTDTLQFKHLMACDKKGIKTVCTAH